MYYNQDQKDCQKKRIWSKSKLDKKDSERETWSEMEEV
jgi:hypothetical protein